MGVSVVQRFVAQFAASEVKPYWMSSEGILLHADRLIYPFDI
jgi:hypothetical protein